jgi:excisionase family DNA binding protein
MNARSAIEELSGTADGSAPRRRRATRPSSGTTEPTRPSLVDREAAAALLGTSARHIRRLAQERRIPYYRIGGKVRFSVVELEAWVDSMAIAPRTRVGGSRR